MPFWEKLAPRERILISAALFLAVIYLLYSYVIMPQWQKYQVLNSELTAVNGEWERLQGIETVLTQEIQNKEKLADELKTIRSEFDFNLEDGAGFTKILGTAKEKNIGLLEFKPGTVVDKSYYFETPVDIKVQGYYPMVLEYISALENFPDLAELKNLTITSISGSKNGYVEAAFSLAIYSSKNPAGVLVIKDYQKISTGKYNPFRPLTVKPAVNAPVNTVTSDSYGENETSEPLVK